MVEPDKPVPEVFRVNVYWSVPLSWVPEIAPTAVNAPAPLNVAASVVPPYHLNCWEVVGTLDHKVLLSIPKP